VIENSFRQGPEAWCSYDYHASIVGGGTNVFILATFTSQGGVDDSGYIWVDHTRWSADTPEKPLSILPLLFYRSWIDADPVDLRDAEISVYLRGDGLRLDGAQCYFWICGLGTRWHYTDHPLDISDACWADEPLRFHLPDDDSRWHRSWSVDPGNPAGLTRLLSQTPSYGFAFVGFSSEVSGRLSMDQFKIELRG
jgi:hypothetical protein